MLKSVDSESILFINLLVLESNDIKISLVCYSTFSLKTSITSLPL